MARNPFPIGMTVFDQSISAAGIVVKTDKTDEVFGKYPVNIKCFMNSSKMIAKCGYTVEEAKKVLIEIFGMKAE